VFTSVQNGRHPDTRQMDRDFESQARQALRNLQTVLEAAGSSLDDVVRLTIHLTDIDNRPAFNEIFWEFFPGELPARGSFGGIDLGVAAGLDVDALVEVEAIAVAR
jgi:2-iminobutanoate/2-iminopropanoate deaminase